MGDDPSGFMHRRMVLATLGALGLAGCAVTTDGPDIQLGGVRSDSGGRLTLPVRVNDVTVRFAVDTAANASVIASDLIEPLGLTLGPETNIHTLIAVERVQTVTARTLQTGALDRRTQRLVVADRSGLGGIDGLLGTDVLAGLRLVMQFNRRRMQVARSRTSGGFLFNEGRSTVQYRAPAEQRFTNLMLVEAFAGGTPCKAIIDTGSRISIINTALARAAQARPLFPDDGSRLQSVHSPTGLSKEAEAMMLPIIGFGGVTLRQVPVLVGDFHTFKLWNLQDTPALLLGVDILGLCKRVSIDLGRSEMLLEV
jgi:hypothetical protein